MQSTYSNTRSSRLRRGLAGAATAALMLATAACDGKPPFDPDGGQPKPPGIGIALSVSSVALVQGDSTGNNGAVHITLTREGGYTGAVELVLEGAPAGVTGTFEPATVDSGATTSRLSLRANGSQETGSFALTVRARGQGVTEKTSALALSVSQAPLQQRFTLALEPNDISIQQGSSAHVAVRATRHGGFGGPVDMVVTSHPPQLGVGVPSITGDVGAITLATVTPGGTLAPGVYTVTLRAFTAAGGAEQTLTLTVRVTPAPVGTSVTWRFCDEGSLPLWVAYQSEDGPWTRSPVLSRTHTFTIGARGGVAWIASSGTNGGYETQVVYGTAAELVQFGSQGCGFGESGGKRLTGEVHATPITGFAQIQIGGAWVRTQPLSRSFVLSGVADGPQDLIASRVDLTKSGTDGGSMAIDRFIIRRGLNLPNNGTIPTLDFGANEAFQPVPAAITLAGLGNDQAMVTLGYLTATSGASPFGGMFGGYYMGMPSRQETQVLPFVPAGRQVAGDLHSLTVAAGDWSGGNSSSMRSRTSFFSAASDRTVTLGPALSAPTVTTATGGSTVRPRTQLARQAEYGSMLWLSFQQSNRELSVTATASYFGGSTTAWDVTVPDFGAAEGFNSQWGLRPGSAIEYSASAFGTSGTVAQMFAPTNGSSWQFAQRGGRLSP
jgi:hypothetical protein